MEGIWALGDLGFEGVGRSCGVRDLWMKLGWKVEVVVPGHVMGLPRRSIVGLGKKGRGGENHLGR